MAGKSGRVFLSYARSDRDAVKRVRRQLQEAGFEVWDPDEEILPGADWSAALKTGLDSATAVIVFISP
jgi:TIR domain